VDILRALLFVLVSFLISHWFFVMKGYDKPYLGKNTVEVEQRQGQEKDETKRFQSNR